MKTQYLLNYYFLKLVKKSSGVLKDCLYHLKVKKNTGAVEEEGKNKFQALMEQKQKPKQRFG